MTGLTLPHVFACTLISIPIYRCHFTYYLIDGVIVSVVEGLECGISWVRQTKDYKIGICCFSAKHTTLRRKSKNWFVQNPNNVSKWSDMSSRGLLFQWASTIKIQLSLLVYYKADLINISLKINLFSPWYSWKIAELALNNNHSFCIQ
jgi:hypothetical protein